MAQVAPRDERRRNKVKFIVPKDQDPFAAVSHQPADLRTHGQTERHILSTSRIARLKYQSLSSGHDQYSIGMRTFYTSGTAMESSCFHDQHPSQTMRCCNTCKLNTEAILHPLWCCERCRLLSQHWGYAHVSPRSSPPPQYDPKLPIKPLKVIFVGGGVGGK